MFQKQMIIMNTVVFIVHTVNMHQNIPLDGECEWTERTADLFYDDSFLLKYVFI